MNEAASTIQNIVASLTAPGTPFELLEKTIAGNPCRVFSHAPATLRDLFENTRQYADLDYLVYQDERLTYEDTYQQAAKIAQVLVDDLGVKKGDRIAIGMRNYPEWITAYFAITSIGGIAVALNALWNGEELAYGLELTGTKIVIADRERAERLQNSMDALDLTLLSVRCDLPKTERVIPLTDAIAGKRSIMPAADVSPDDDAIIFFTSGSTGHPKGAVSTHRAVIHALMSWDFDQEAGAAIAGIERPNEPWDERSKFLLAVPLFHVSGAHAGMMLAAIRGRMINLVYKWDVMQALDIIEKEQITHFLAVSTMTGDLVRAAAENNRSLDSLLAVGGGGSARPAQQARDIDQVFTNAAPSHGWGMTETNAIGTGTAGEAYLERPLSSGLCSSVLDLHIVDDEDSDVTAGDPGHLLIRGTSMFREYWNRPDATKESFVDGWFRTGDIARIDDAGFLFIVDRAKDIVIRGGENIGCGEVEDAVSSHNAVNEAIVFGLPHDRLGEEVATMISLKPGSSVTESELQDYLQDRLASFQIPTRIFITEEPLPRIASGKFNKRGVRNELLEKLAEA